MNNKELTITLNDEMEVYELLILIQNYINRLKKENYEHQDMINMLEGSNNSRAKNRYEIAKTCLEINNEKVKHMRNVYEQLKKINTIGNN